MALRSRPAQAFRRCEGLALHAYHTHEKCQWPIAESLDWLPAGSYLHKYQRLILHTALGLVHEQSTTGRRYLGQSPGYQTQRCSMLV